MEYWIVDTTGLCVHVFRLPQGAAYGERSIVKCGEKLSPLVAIDAVLDIQELFGLG